MPRIIAPTNTVRLSLGEFAAWVEGVSFPYWRLLRELAILARLRGAR